MAREDVRGPFRPVRTSVPGIDLCEHFPLMATMAERFARITRFIGEALGQTGLARPVPTTITCGTAEENLDNNRALVEALGRRGWEPRTFWNRDAHNWTAWRDALHPHLAELLLRAWI